MESQEIIKKINILLRINKYNYQNQGYYKALHVKRVMIILKKSLSENLKKG